MELERINNLWKFLSIKNNLKLDCSKDKEVAYQLTKGNLVLKHIFNPQLLQQSKLLIGDKNFQEKFCQHAYVSSKKRFGFKEKPASLTSQKIFFPKELLLKYRKFDLEICKDYQGHIQVSIGPFFPKNIYEILNQVNPIARTFWVKNFFAEGIRN
ncbi:hypothetical protein [Cecembia calidifontis]|jgi:hypothetical protein|uniref:Uncharacterized protein n=1 Tax=Cecembia calidifontis TaxID=1187080 RepID=A0A4Q7P6V1_9BACT|nr:hypothetical protein [Cecembia calidifontis]RZS95725.1 hypothetical protein BC751_1265 [Cecembia calidifontis]